jgi:hypothetical protein
MEAHRQKIDRSYIERRNDESKHLIESKRAFLDRVDNDIDRKNRLAVQECPICFKTARIGGASMTERQCAHCEEMIRSGSTNVDVLCLECARKTKLCKHCGADIDLKNRRKRDLPD